MEHFCGLLFQLLKHGTNTLHVAFYIYFSVYTVHVYGSLCLLPTLASWSPSNVMVCISLWCCFPRLVLQASDRGSPPLSSITTVRVQVVDINDNSPAIPPMEPVVMAESKTPTLSNGTLFLLQYTTFDQG
jgi:hypothetical protein